MPMPLAPPPFGLIQRVVELVVLAPSRIPAGLLPLRRLHRHPVLLPLLLICLLFLLLLHVLIWGQINRPEPSPSCP